MTTNTENTVLPKIEAESITDKVRTAIRNYVLSGKIQPGTRLVEAQLAEQLGVSRAPVREALLALETEGLVVSIPGKGAVVAEMTEEDLREIYTVRSVLEGLAMRLAAQAINRDGLNKLADIVARMKRAAQDGDAEQVAALDFEFHQQIWTLSGHKKLYQLLTGMMTQIRMFLALNAKLYTDLLDNCMEHVTLFEALSSGDAGRAEQLVVEHIEEAGKLNIHYLRQIKQE